MQNFKFFLMLGTLALLNGYTREAVSSLTTALKDFMNSICKLSVIKRGIPLSKFQDVFKLMSSQSERQLGAFYFCKLMNSKDSA
jgi:hypothetical protein